MSKLHDKVNRNRMTQYVCICIYTYIPGGIGTAAIYTTGVLLRYAFFRSASTIQRCRGHGGTTEKEKQTQRWLGASKRNTCMSLDTAVRA